MSRLKNKKILVVDDDKRNIKLLEAQLSISGYEVITACNGQQAILETEDNLPDLIILDFMMPAMSGAQVALYLKKNPNTENIPIIFLTSILKKDFLDKESVNVIGNEYVIAKPVAKKELLRTIEAALKRAKK